MSVACGLFIFVLTSIGVSARVEAATFILPLGVQSFTVLGDIPTTSFGSINLSGFTVPDPNSCPANSNCQFSIDGGVTATNSLPSSSLEVKIMLGNIQWVNLPSWVRMHLYCYSGIFPDRRFAPNANCYEWLWAVRARRLVPRTFTVW